MTSRKAECLQILLHYWSGITLKTAQQASCVLQMNTLVCLTILVDSYLSEPCHRAGKSLPLLSHTLLFCPFLQFSGWRHWELLLKDEKKNPLTFVTDSDLKKKTKKTSTTHSNATERQASNTTYLNLFF